METDKEKYELIENAINECIGKLKTVEPQLGQISYEGESPFKKSEMKREMEYLLTDLNKYIDRINNRNFNKIPKF
jgi:SPX domain protein involved in polyphosphate accumulation